MFVYKKDHMNVPLKIWVSKDEYFKDGKLVEQTETLTKLPFVFHHVGLSADGHVGYGMPIGGIMAAKDTVVPNAVGVDIGCGMSAIKTNLHIDDIDQGMIKKIMSGIRRRVPVGFSHRTGNHRNARRAMPLLGTDVLTVVEKQWDAALYQLGTLGGGNHFIEIQKDEDGFIWFMIHSGSRNLGKQVADHYNKVAQKLNEKWNSAVPKGWDLAFLPTDSDEGQAYIAEMQYCVDFAFANRAEMMTDVIDVAVEAVGEFDRDEMINIAHNYAALENHFGENVWVHRKGATRARSGELGIIPGSQGTASYIVVGKGNAESFQSCSHGSGRVMGRNEARKKLDLAEEIKKLDDQGIVHSIRSAKDLDEASGAYKDIETVMNNQTDLVDIKVKLTPLAVVKG